VLVIYGFPSRFAALQFEWAWQNPHKSRHFKGMGTYTGKQKERYLPTKLKVLMDMLYLENWRRWPLSIHITCSEVQTAFMSQIRQLPRHVRLTTGSLTTLPYSEAQLQSDENLGMHEDAKCHVCKEMIELEDTMSWLSCPSCPALTHLLCLSKVPRTNLKVFLQQEASLNLASSRTQPKLLIPIHGSCPACKCDCKWGKLISAMKARAESEKTADADKANAEPRIEVVIPKAAHCKKSRKTIQLDSSAEEDFEAFPDYDEFEPSSSRLIFDPKHHNGGADEVIVLDSSSDEDSDVSEILLSTMYIS
jgi:hypothetical protein